MVLLLGGREIDGLAIDEREFAMDDRRADGASNGGEHFERKFTRERWEGRKR